MNLTTEVARLTAERDSALKKLVAALQPFADGLTLGEAAGATAGCLRTTEKALEDTRDELRAVKGLLGEAIEWMHANPPSDGWGVLDRESDRDRRDISTRASRALGES